jgi:hypothetical protein
MFSIYGKTFLYRKQLRALGCRWNQPLRCWETNDPAVARLCAGWFDVLVTGGVDKTAKAPLQAPKGRKS